MPTFYAATTGSDAAAGSDAAPWSLAWATSSSNTTLQAGDTVIIQNGTYTGTTFTFTKAGSTDNPIVYRAETEGSVTIDAQTNTNGADTWFVGITFAYLTAEPRYSATHTTLTRWGRSIGAQAARQRFIQCRMHNLLNGLFGGTLSPNLRVEECLIYNNGVEGADRKHGHGLYLQNIAANGRKLIRNNVIWGSFFAGQQWYGAAAEVTGITAEYNAQFNNASANFVVYAESGDCGDHIIRHNALQGVGMAFDSNARDILVSQNVVDNGAISFFAGDRFQAFDNTVVWRTATYPDGLIFSYLRDAQPSSDHQFDRNAIYRHSGSQTPFYGTGAGPFSLATWRSVRGYDANGTVAEGVPANRVVAIPSSYTKGRGHLHVWNFDGASSVAASLATIVPMGFPYAIYHVFDFVTGGAPLVQGTYTGGTVTIPMDARTPPTPLGGSALPTMPNTFGVFVVVPRPGYTIRTRGSLG